jgi:DNA invertase Pin-like site-specific DNA recombinase
LKKEIEKFKLHNKAKKQGMKKKASQGKLMSRAPFGYIIQEGNLVPAPYYKEVEEIFESFLDRVPKEMSLRQLAKPHSLSVNGLKKVLRNFTYIGKIKFDNEIHTGNHKPLISSTLFNRVQDKLEKMGIK